MWINSVSGLRFEVTTHYDHIIQGGKKTTPNFGSHFDMLSEIFYSLFILVILMRVLFDISCENMDNIAFILFEILVREEVKN